MEELQIFKSPEFGEIRTTEINGEPYFVGKDIADALGYAKPENALAANVTGKGQIYFLNKFVKQKEAES